MTRFTGRSTALLAAALLAPAAASAAEVKVENYSNGTVYVAQADNHGRAVSHGWTAIPANGSRTITAPDAADLYLRVQDAAGREVTFQHHKTFLTFPTRADRFRVVTEPDDRTVWVLKHGPNLQFSHNVNKGGPLPAGWKHSRFFRIGTGNHKLEIKP